MGSVKNEPAPVLMTRFQAQRMLGLFAPHDYLMLACAVLSLMACGGYYHFNPEPNLVKMVLVFCVIIIFLLAWLIVLVYRAMVFVLDLHSDVALMPEASARIAVGFMQGASKKP